MEMKIRSNNTFISKAVGKTLSIIQPVLDSADNASIVPFTESTIMTPRWNEFRYSWTHYGLFFSDLPEPHRFLNIMIHFGVPNAKAFDHDYLTSGNLRKTATIFSGTAACEKFLLKAYIWNKDCFTKKDGSEIVLGQELKILGKYPNVRLLGEYSGLDIDIKVHITNQVSWFIKNVFYDHFSLLATYQGRILYENKTFPVKGLCTYEYARCSFGLHGIRQKKSNKKYLIPMDFFTYQILKIEDDIQILMTKTDVLGKPSCYCIHVRKLGGYSEYYSDVEFKIVEYQENELIGLDGEKTRVPKRISWVAKDRFNQIVLSIDGVVDTPFYYGHGRGYVTSYRFSGIFKGSKVSGRCYMEYVDVGL